MQSFLIFKVTVQNISLRQKQLFFRGSKEENCEKGLKVKADMIKCNYSEPTAFMGRQRKWIANVRVT